MLLRWASRLAARRAVEIARGLPRMPPDGVNADFRGFDKLLIPGFYKILRIKSKRMNSFTTLQFIYFYNIFYPGFQKNYDISAE